MRKLNIKNKLCIYLDQYVVSNLISCPNSIWVTIREQLENKHTSNKIYCPLSTAHFIETVKKTIDNAKTHDEYFRTLSDNLLFKDEPFLTAQLISSLIRKYNNTTKTYLEYIELRNIESFYKVLNEKNRIFENSVNSAVDLSNQIRRVSVAKIEKELEYTLFNTIKTNTVQNFVARLREYLEKGEMRIRPDIIGTYSFPNWIDQLLYQLTVRHKFDKKLFSLLLSELETNGFNNIQTLNTKFSLYAHIAVKQKQESVSDHIDVMRISNGLIISDVLFTDKRRKHEIQELNLDKKYNTKIFSGVENDLREFIEYIEEI